MKEYIDLVRKLINVCQNNSIENPDVDLAAELTALYEYLERVERVNLDFEEIANHLYDGIYISDGDANTLFINNAYTRITGITPEMVLGRNVVDIVAEGLLYKNAVTLEVIKQKKTVNAIGQSLVNKKKMLITGSPILDADGNVKKVVINNRAMTDLDEIKSQLDTTKNKLKISQQENIKKNHELSIFRKNQIDTVSFIGECLALQNIKALIEQVAPTDASVLITGSTGTGKEVVANGIVKYSRRSEKPFIKINCSAIPESLLESELFGYVKGAFTGANKEGHLGLFEIANGGTLLLDEIGDMPMDLQCKILRVLQEKEITRIGSHKSIPIDVRIISSTNKDIKRLIQTGEFREDLFYRINVLPINLPPLCDRGDDILLFKDYFLAKYNKKYSKDLNLDTRTVDVLKRYSWPGNIREFENVIERLVIIAADSGAAHSIVELMLHLENPAEDHVDTEKPYKEQVHDFERKLLGEALEKYKTTTNAAKYLKLDQSTIVKKKQRLGIE
jgi:PAS domain S-box-containing protein